MAKKHSKTSVVLLDTHAIIHRAYHALPDFSSSKGMPTGALYGVAAMLMKIIDELKPTHIIACYDLPGGTFRNDISQDYKATRKEAEEDLIMQIKKSREILDAFSIPWYEKEGYEADDLLGTIAEKLKKQKDVSVIIATGDMDTLQLVDDDIVCVYTLKRGINDTVLYDEDAVRARFGFGPEYLPDYKGLRGDPSDNIVGVKGIGEKTATTLVTAYGTIEKIYKVLQHDQAAFQKKTGLTDRLIGILKENEEEALFSKTLAQIIIDVPIDFSLPAHPWRETVAPEAIRDIFSELEFRSLYDRFKNQFSIQEEPENTPDAEEDVSSREILETGIALWLINSELTNPSFDDILAYGKTGSFEAAKKKIFDDLAAEKLTRVFEEIERPIIDAVAKMKRNGITIDTDCFKQLSSAYHKRLDEIEERIYELAGTEFNIKSPQQLSEVLFDRLSLPTKGVKKSTATGAYSTRIEVLHKLQGEHEIIDEIIDYRELQKLLSTYVDVIPKMVADDGKLHATFLQHGTTTGRFSSIDPNLQNIPTRTELGRAIREGFVASEGTVLLGLDYSQIELRIAAMLSGDEKLTAIFNEGKDIHAGVASYMFHVPEGEVTRNMRNMAKVINFGIIYGMGVNALQKNLKSSRKEAKEFYENYFERFEGVRAYLEESKEFARTHGYTETLFGRRRQFPGIYSSVPYIRASNERMAINAPIQGTQADIIKLAIKHITTALHDAQLQEQTRLLLQIHDELIYEVDTAVIEKVRPLIKEKMEQVFENSFLSISPSVPIVVETATGKTWGELK